MFDPIDGDLTTVSAKARYLLCSATAISNTVFSLVGCICMCVSTELFIQGIE